MSTSYTTLLSLQSWGVFRLPKVMFNKEFAQKQTSPTLERITIIKSYITNYLNLQL